jgi:hypothetical protein
MGVKELVATALKGVTLEKLAGLAVEHGPGLYRRAMDGLQKKETSREPSAAEIELHERIARLEHLLVEQEGVIREQLTRLEEQEDACCRLAIQVRRFRAATGVLAVVVLVLGLLVIRQ